MDPQTEPELYRWAKDHRRSRMGKSSDRRAIKLECSCGLTVGRLTGSPDGTYGGLVGIEKDERTFPGSDGRGVSYTPSTVGPSGRHNVPADAGAEWKWADLAPMFDRQTIKCAARSCRREWLYRRDTLERAYSRAVEAGRRTLELGVDL